MPVPPRSDGNPHERTFWELLPRRNLRRAIFLVFALLAVLALKRGGVGAFFNRMLDSFAPPPPPAPAPVFRHLEVKPPPPAPPR
jgi:hypothetical protein